MMFFYLFQSREIIPTLDEVTLKKQEEERRKTVEAQIGQNMVLLMKHAHMTYLGWKMIFLAACNHLSQGRNSCHTIKEHVTASVQFSCVRLNVLLLGCDSVAA